MKAIEDIEKHYLPLVKRFLPHMVDQAGEIGYQIDLFLSDNAEKYENPTNFRLKQEGEILSETLYDAVKFESESKKQEDDLCLIVEGSNVFLGFDYV